MVLIGNLVSCSEKIIQIENKGESNPDMCGQLSGSKRKNAQSKLFYMFSLGNEPTGRKMLNLLSHQEKLGNNNKVSFVEKQRSCRSISLFTHQVRLIFIVSNLKQ